MTTVLTLEPLDFNLLGNTLRLQLRGIPCRNRTVVKVDYPANFETNSIEDGVTALNEAIHDIAGEKLVFAHSQGAQVVSRWLRRYSAAAGGTDAPPPEELSFLLIGNPLRKYGGWIIGKPEVDGRKGIPTPNNTEYSVTDLTMQYDGWSDWPTGRWLTTPGGIVARVNATYGKNNRHCYGYLLANPDSPLKKTYVENTTSYEIIPALPCVPYLSQMLIETAYRRPEFAVQYGDANLEP